MRMEQSEGAQRVAGAVRARRVELGYSSQQALAQAADLGTRTIAMAETGERLAIRSKLRLEKVLRWQQGTIDAVLDGERDEPEVDDNIRPDAPAQTQVRSPEAAAALWLSIYEDGGYNALRAIRRRYARFLPDEMMESIEDHFGRLISGAPDAS